MRWSLSMAISTSIPPLAATTRAICGPSLYRNEGHKNHWLGIDLGEGAIGAWLRLRADDHLGVVEIGSGPGFGSTNDLRAEIGLGARTRIDSLEIRWPDGAIERHTDLDQFHRF